MLLCARLRDELRAQHKRAAAQEADLVTVHGQAAMRERALVKAAADAEALNQRVLAAESALHNVSACCRYRSLCCGLAKRAVHILHGSNELPRSKDDRFLPCKELAS